MQVYERAAPFFELAARLQPQEPKWALMVASCYRRVGGRQPLLPLPGTRPLLPAGGEPAADSSVRCRERLPYLAVVPTPGPSHLLQAPCPPPWLVTSRSTPPTPPTWSACATWCTCAASWAAGTTRRSTRSGSGEQRGRRSVPGLLAVADGWRWHACRAAPQMPGQSRTQALACWIAVAAIQQGADFLCCHAGKHAAGGDSGASAGCR
jgi:hypothetical protein